MGLKRGIPRLMQQIIKSLTESRDSTEQSRKEIENIFVFTRDFVRLMCASQENDILLFHVSHSHYIQTLLNIFFSCLYQPASFHRLPSNYRTFEHEIVVKSR